MTRVLALWALAAACGGGAGSSTSGASGTASHGGSTGATTSHTGSGSTGASTGTVGSTTGATTGQASSTAPGSTTGGLTGPVYTPCPTGFAYFAGNCLAATCAGVPYDTPCGLPDSGVGFCGGGSCQAIDRSTDPANCGSFGLACAAGAQCLFGVCDAPGGGTTSCPTAQCPAGRVCVQALGCPYTSSCAGAPNDAACEGVAGEGICCAGTCVAPATDAQNCGGCGLACPAGAVCAAGSCVATVCLLDAGFGTRCEIVGGGFGQCCGGACVDTLASLASCGSCGATCPASAFGCYGGTCAPGCTSSAACASGVCLNGVCLSTICGPGSQQRACALPESTGLTVQGGCCGSSCADLQADPQNCGQCGVSCDGGACVGGRCVGAPPTSDCSGAAGGAACWAQGRQGTCCGGACTFDDDANCGGCGLGCPPTATCTAAAYGPQCLLGLSSLTCRANGCDAGQACDVNGAFCIPSSCTLATEGEPCAAAGAQGVCCGGACVVTATDPKNCGLCGRSCPAGTACAGGVCGGSAGGAAPGCPAGAACEAQLGCIQTGCADAGNGRVCAFGVPLGGSALGLGLCCGGACVDPGQDPRNCGGCGLDCDGGSCLGSRAQVACYGAHPIAACLQSCAPGTYCAGSACVPVSCDSLGQVCPAPDGPLGLCCATSAGLLTCADLSTDPDNCGACAVRCPSGQSCRAGVCSGTAAPCNAPGQRGAYCDLSKNTTSICCPGTGCVDTATDNGNCGACGVGCPLGTTCAAGACQ